MCWPLCDQDKALFKRDLAYGASLYLEADTAGSDRRSFFMNKSALAAASGRQSEQAADQQKAAWGLGWRETSLIPDQQKAAWGLGWRETSLIPDPPLGFSFPVAWPAEQSGHLGFSLVAWA